MTTKGLLKQAEKEYADTGTLATDTYMALNNAGLNADLVLAQIAGEIEDGED